MRLIVKFSLEVGLVRAAHASALGAAPLGHEAGDHTVELNSVIESFAGQLLDPGNVTRRKIRAQADAHIPAAAIAGIEREGQKFVGHGNLQIGQVIPFARI